MKKLLALLVGLLLATQCGPALCMNKDKCYESNLSDDSGEDASSSEGGVYINVNGSKITSLRPWDYKIFYNPRYETIEYQNGKLHLIFCIKALNDLDNNKRYPLSYALQLEDSNFLSLLLEYGADPNKQLNSLDKTFLMQGFEIIDTKKRHDCLKILLAGNADPLRLSQGSTILHYAVLWNRLEDVRIILDENFIAKNDFQKKIIRNHGLVNMKNWCGLVPKQLTNNEQIIELLEEYEK